MECHGKGQSSWSVQDNTTGPALQAYEQVGKIFELAVVEHVIATTSDARGGVVLEYITAWQEHVQFFGVVNSIWTPLNVKSQAFVLTEPIPVLVCSRGAF
jgi:hypothetical protein